MTKLYHFTCAEHMPAIVSDGFLKVTESNVSFRREHAGPDVVWLTTEPTAELGHGLSGGVADKTRVRFTVDVPEAEVSKWEPWAIHHGATRKTRDTLARTGGGSDTWYVIERPIPVDEWLDVIDTRTGKSLVRQE